MDRIKRRVCPGLSIAWYCESIDSVHLHATHSYVIAFLSYSVVIPRHAYIDIYQAELLKLFKQTFTVAFLGRCLYPRRILLEIR